MSYDEEDDERNEEENRAPICRFCGVTALPAETSNVIDGGFVCDNADCDGYEAPVS